MWVFVLYPWHEELQHDFNNLRKEHLETLRGVKADVEDLKREHVKVLDALKSELQSTKSRGLLGFGSTTKS
ncbi:hypothetical protein B0I35DRAFT_482557 [Stachybotrys elegans]|uniref:Uncharacterized protein n=1 Tax=Stachybotrys elegans TaxID=80388 RepID=A0A8K0SMT0_9HYPO|nr:hypothetical protein B0I35DRAFT_482557 [Stachybotrys elegans]